MGKFGNRGDGCGCSSTWTGTQPSSYGRRHISSTETGKQVLAEAGMVDGYDKSKARVSLSAGAVKTLTINGAAPGEARAFSRAQLTSVTNTDGVTGIDLASTDGVTSAGTERQRRIELVPVRYTRRGMVYRQQVVDSFVERQQVQSQSVIINEIPDSMGRLKLSLGSQDRAFINLAEIRKNCLINLEKTPGTAGKAVLIVGSGRPVESVSFDPAKGTAVLRVGGQEIGVSGISAPEDLLVASSTLDASQGVLADIGAVAAAVSTRVGESAKSEAPTATQPTVTGASDKIIADKDREIAQLKAEIAEMKKQIEEMRKLMQSAKPDAKPEVAPGSSLPASPDSSQTESQTQGSPEEWRLENAASPEATPQEQRAQEDELEDAIRPAPIPDDLSQASDANKVEQRPPVVANPSANPSADVPLPSEPTAGGDEAAVSQPKVEPQIDYSARAAVLHGQLGGWAWGFFDMGVSAQIKVMQQFSDLTDEQAKRLKEEYEKRYSSDLLNDIDKRLSVGRATALKAKLTGFDAEKLAAEVDSNINASLDDNPAMIVDLISNLPFDRRQAVDRAFKTKTNQTIMQALKADYAWNENVIPTEPFLNGRDINGLREAAELYHLMDGLGSNDEQLILATLQRAGTTPAQIAKVFDEYFSKGWSNQTLLQVLEDELVTDSVRKAKELIESSSSGL